MQFLYGVHEYGGTADTLRLERSASLHWEFESPYSYGKMAERLLHTLAKGAG